MRWRGLVLLLCCLCGCSRTWYRLDADQDTYTELQKKLSDPRWYLPRTDIDVPPASRLYDPSNPDYPPFPPDDPAANEFMIRADGHRGWKHWHRNGDSPSIEFPGWRADLRLEPDGYLLLTPDRAVKLALLHSREYQTQQENLYLVSLALTLNQFEFALQWFAGNNINFEHFGSGGFPTETNTLNNTSAIGFTKMFAAGGQILVNLANSFTWEYTGHTSSVNSSFGMTFLQPLLQGAGRQVRLEALTQGERNLLYAVRRFARFRKEFYFTIAVEQYQNLLQLLQQIRNQESNLKTIEQQYLVIAARRLAGEASLAEEDQAYSSFKQSEIQLIQSKTNLENQLDAYKLVLGLPPEIPVRLDADILKAFEFVSPEIAQFQEQVTLYVKSVARPDAPLTVPQLRDEYARLAELRKRTEQFALGVRQEVLQLKSKQAAKLADPGPDYRRFQSNFQQMDQQSQELITDLQRFGGEIDRKASNLTEAGRKASQGDLWKKARDLSNLVGQLYVIQTQARIYLLELPNASFDEPGSIDTALNERLDLMNQRAIVIDAWRQIEVAANALLSVLNVQGNMQLGTNADGDTPFDFSALASRYRVGLQFDGPLNREAQRNTYRQVQIQYQRARREFMLFQDNIVRSIRQDIRQLGTDRLNFDINRQSLIATARQIEQNQYSLLFGDNRNVQADTTSILTALNNLLSAQNTLIAQWFSFERGRLRLLLDTEQFQVDDDGIFREPGRQSGRPAEPLPPPSPAGPGVGLPGGIGPLPPPGSQQKP